ncbi:hypothetical protein B0H13DRAFT_951679 [Mycena leptocephala]|nr:hypothetical protein B0H13DRAFT_951679 [Mycena leptocephala]
MGISPAHVLAVAPDALDAQDALQLWSVFSKCKDSLQDGRRLENISWRLAFRELSQNRRLLDGPWPPTPESVSSDDSGGTKSSSTDNSTSSSGSAASPFFHIPPRNPTATAGRSAGRIICDMIPPGLTQKLTERQKDVKKDQAYPTPASSSSSSSGSSSTSSSSVSISVESPAAQEPEVPRVKITNATPNLTPHPTPPATPLLAATAPPRALSPSGLSTPASLASSPPIRRDPPGPLFLPRSATRGMGSPVFPPLDSQHAPAPPAPYAPQSTHILPLGGRELTAPIPAPPVNGNALGKSAPRGKGGFYLHAPASGSSHSSSRSSGTSNSYENDRASASGSGSGSDSSRERGEEAQFVGGV